MPPCSNATGEHVHVGVLTRKNCRAALAKPLAVIAQHDAGAAAGHDARKFKLNPAQGYAAGKQQVAAGEYQFLAHIDERELLSVSVHRPERTRRDGAHQGPPPYGRKVRPDSILAEENAWCAALAAAKELCRAAREVLGELSVRRALRQHAACRQQEPAQENIPGSIHLVHAKVAAKELPAPQPASRESSVETSLLSNSGISNEPGSSKQQVKSTKVEDRLPQASNQDAARAAEQKKIVAAERLAAEERVRARLAWERHQADRASAEARDRLTGMVIVLSLLLLGMLALIHRFQRPGRPIRTLARLRALGSFSKAQA